MCEGIALPDPDGILLGNGTMVRYLRLTSAADLDQPAVKAVTGRSSGVTPSDLSAALRPVLDALAGLGVRHFVAGSIANSAHGVPRAIINADWWPNFSPATRRR